MRKNRSDSSAEAIRCATAPAVHPPSTVPLEKEDLPFFVNVVDEFARADWTAHQLELAAMLARTMADLEREQCALREEGSIAYSTKGTPVVNPRKTVIQMHSSTILSYRRSLHLHAASKGEARDKAKRIRDGKASQGDENSDDLLARPS